MTPLGVISSFLTLTEVVVAYALVNTTGDVQNRLAVFVTVFPFFVGAAFFLILWRHPTHLYAPKDYGSEVDVAAFAEAVRPRKAEGDAAARITDRFAEAITSTETVANIINAATRRSKEAPDRVSAALRSAVHTAGATLRESDFLTIDPRPLIDQAASNELIARAVTDGGGAPWTMLFEGDRAVSLFLDEIWFRLIPLVHVPAYTYGRTWVLAERDGKVFDDIGRDWAEARGLEDDTRALWDVGIRAGMTLEIKTP
ncbi:MAG TPA: hypothetical protein VG318_03555 [Actinomycetota bacterium]|nr:hypothetical protein [Actinomycetota bacterium]